jgi:hypothetical protein
MYGTTCKIFGVPSQTSVFLLVTGYTSEIHRMPSGGSVHYIHLSAVSLNPGGPRSFLALLLSRVFTHCWSGWKTLIRDKIFFRSWANQQRCGEPCKREDYTREPTSQLITHNLALTSTCITQAPWEGNSWLSLSRNFPHFLEREDTREVQCCITMFVLYWLQEHECFILHD